MPVERIGRASSATRVIAPRAYHDTIPYWSFRITANAILPRQTHSARPALVFLVCLLLVAGLGFVVNPLHEGQHLPYPKSCLVDSICIFSKRFLF